MKEKSDIYQEFLEIKHLYQNIKAKINNEETYPKILFNNIPQQKILKYIENQIYYANKKLNKIFSLCLDKQHLINEGIFIRQNNNKIIL